jgi:hypothetical protein
LDVTALLTVTTSRKVAGEEWCMSEGGGGDFVVDLLALDDLLGRVRELRASLDVKNDAYCISVNDSGSQPLSGAVGDFVGRWADGRARVRNNLDTIVESMAATIEEYRSTEAHNTLTFDGPET